MFTGIVERIGTVRSAEAVRNGVRFGIEAGADYLAPVGLGGSIALDGVCTTVVALEGDVFHVEAIGTTLSRTTLGTFAPGRKVNLERPLALGGALGGHLVQGHVDAVGTVRAVTREGEHVLLDVAMPDEVADVTVLHGSITVDGVSLTVNALPADDTLQVSLIEHTRRATTLGDARPGMLVHLEADVIAKYVHRLAAPYLAGRPS